MLDTICSPTQRDDILYQWKTDEHLLRRNTFIGDLYNEFQKKKDAFTLLKVMMANYILEGVYFYSGFMFFYNLARNGKMPGSAQEIRYICLLYTSFPARVPHGAVGQRFHYISHARGRQPENGRSGGKRMSRPHVSQIMKRTAFSCFHPAGIVLE